MYIDYNYVHCVHLLMPLFIFVHVCVASIISSALSVYLQRFVVALPSCSVILIGCTIKSAHVFSAHAWDGAARGRREASCVLALLDGLRLATRAGQPSARVSQETKWAFQSNDTVAHAGNFWSFWSCLLRLHIANIKSTTTSRMRFVCLECRSFLDLFSFSRVQVQAL